MALICGFAAIFGAAAPAGAATESFVLTSAAVSGQSSVTWQGPPVNPPSTPNDFPDATNPITLNGQIDSSTGNISAASLSLPAIAISADGENTSFAFFAVHPGTATGNFNSSTGAVTLNDTFTLTFSVPAIPITCVSTPINVALSGTWDSTSENVTLATTSSFTIPQFPANSGTNCGLASASLNASPGGTAGGVGNAMSLALNGQFAPGLPTTTTLTTSVPSPQLAGTSVTLTANVTDPSGSGTPTGNVTFDANGGSIGTGTLSSGTATLTTTSLPGSANQQLTAVYGGDTTYAGSTSSAVPYTIQPKPSVSANLPAAPVTVGAAATPFTITVNNPASGQSYDNVYLEIVLSGLSQTRGGAYPTISYEDSGGNWCPLSGSTTLYFSGAAPAPCGSNTPPGSMSLDAGTTLTIPMEIAYASNANVGLQAVTTTLYTGSCTNSTTCAAVTPLSGSAAPNAVGAFTVAPASPLTTTISSYILPTPQGYVADTGVSLAAGSTEDSPPTGTVTEVFNYTTPIGSFPLVDGGSTATFSTAGVAPGTYPISVAYSGDAVYASTTGVITLTVLAPNPGVAYTCTGNGIEGSAGPFAANVVVTANSLPQWVPSGTDVAVSGLNVTMRADFVGAGSGTGAIKAGATTAQTFQLSPSATVAGPNITFVTTYATNDTWTGTWTGMSTTVPVTGSPGDTVPVTLSSFAWTSTGTVPGQGTYSGTCIPANSAQPATLGAITVSGNTLTASPTGSATTGSPVTLTDTVSPSQIVYTKAGLTEPVGGQVDFYDGTTDLATVPVGATGTAVFTTNALSVGDHQLTAVWSGGGNIPTNTSNTVDYVVGTTTTTALASSANPANAANPVTFTATVSPPPGASTQPTGDVSFTQDGNPIASCASQPLSMASPPTATCTTSFGAGESHAIVATYSGDGTYLGSASDPLTQTTLPGTNTTILSTKDPSPPGKVTFWAGVSPSAGTGATPTGTVAFTIDGKTYAPCGSAPLGSGGGASCTVSFKANTTHKVSATYPGSSSYSGSTSNTITQTVTGSSSSTKPKTSTGSATLGPGKTLTSGQSLTAGAYRLTMQSDGNLVEYQGTKALWATGTAGHPGAGVVMQKNGNLAIFSQGKAIWSTKTAGHEGAHLTLQAKDGNVVIYTTANKAVWSTGT